MSHGDISENDRKKFLSWLLNEGYDPEVSSFLEDYASSRNSVSGTGDAAGLMNILDEISGKRRRQRWAVALAAACVLLVAVFSAGFFLRSRHLPETTLLASGAGVSRHALPDGSVIWLAGGSSVSFRGGLSGETREVLLEGSAFFDVARDKTRPFRVNFADGAVAEVLGTSFTAVSDGGLKEIVLQTGSVKVSSPLLGAPVLLEPDSRLLVSESGGRVETVESQALCKWHNPSLVFDGDRLGDVLQNISCRYNVEIDMRAAVSRDKKITMTIDTESLSDVMTLLERILPIRAVIQGRDVVIHDK